MKKASCPVNSKSRIGVIEISRLWIKIYLEFGDVDIFSAISLLAVTDDAQPCPLAVRRVEGVMSGTTAVSGSLFSIRINCICTGICDGVPNLRNWMQLPFP